MMTLAVKIYLNPEKKQIGLRVNEPIPDSLYYHLATQTLSVFEGAVVSKETEAAINGLLAGYLANIYARNILRKDHTGAWVVRGDLPDMTGVPEKCLE